MKKKMTVWRVLRSVLIVLVLIAAAYVTYVFMAYHRIGSMPLAISSEEKESGPVRTGEKLSVTS